MISGSFWQRAGGWARAYRVELLLFLLLWSTYAYFYQGMGDNEAVRIDQLRAFVEDHTFKIDKYFWNSADIVFYPPPPQPGSVYPNKAPGQTFLLAPIYGVVRMALLPLLKLGVPEWCYWHIVTYVLTLLTAGLFSALAGIAMYRVALAISGDARASVFAVIAIWLGTLLFPFSTLFFSHAITAALLVFAFYLLFQIRQGEQSSLGIVFLIGAFLSLALAGEYPAAMSAGLLCLYAVWIGWRRKATPRHRLTCAVVFASGLSLGVLLLLAYNYAAFGNPFYLAYQSYSRPGTYFHETYARGWMGIRWGGVSQLLHALGAILIFPPIGLMYVKVERWAVYANNPVLWLALPGLVALLWRRAWRAEGLLVAALSAAYLLFLSSYGVSVYDWAGATFIGPRHLIPMLPFLAIPLCLVARRLCWLFVPLLALSVFYMLLATAIDPRVPLPFPVPARDLLLPDYLHGKLAQNDHRLFDSGQHLLTHDSTAFNLPKLAGVAGRLQLVPLAFWWALLGSALILATRQPGSRSPGFSIALLIASATALAAAPPIHHAWFGPKVSNHGLLGKYYRNANWSGAPVEMQVDPVIDFDWADRMPLQPPFSIEWSGQLVVEQPGEYQFALRADDGALLEIDGETVIDATHQLLQESNRTRTLTAGTHHIRVRYLNLLFGGSVHLWWQLSGRPKQIIPSDALVPDPPPAIAGKATSAN